ncbi:tetratricopeptide repeat-containing protein [Massilia sp. TSP1-1-2]|uniref:tetratricopeptide repeat-containing protein n=1 Tax=Massilia sp. TSP1-1-2 TaxID=2804649 RepID=UPI003CFB5422
MADDQRKVCFVVMGFGKKTDYESGRTLDMDATYEAIIRPAVVAAGMRCIRADEITHSGLIDMPMYDMLLRSELVIADISTGNVNAVYELGVRHALRPHSTIIIKESAGRLSFDLNHVSTLHYEHLGADIGHREALRARLALGKLIDSVMAEHKADSPVYTFLPRLRQPRLNDDKYEALLSQAESMHGQLSGHLSAGNQALRADQFNQAASAFAAAEQLKPGDPSIVQKLALATYKSQLPSSGAALSAGIAVIAALDPEGSNDPETLGIAGAMHKQRWQLQHDRADLETAIRYYGRGFVLRRDYYNGENLATCYDFRSGIQSDAAQSMYDSMSATKVRQELIEQLTAAMAAPSFEERSDRKWMHATLANCYFALGRIDEGAQQEHAFVQQAPEQWERDSFAAGKQAALHSAARTTK